MRPKGVIAAGHPLSAEAAAQILEAGGNAFDAAIAAFFAACVCEPVLASPAGGGFLLAACADGSETLFDFFVQTPLAPAAGRELDFYPIRADFGSARQEFHIGLGAVATPGCVHGLFDAHARLCRLPMTRLVELAVALARGGVRVNALQARVFEIVSPIYRADEAVRGLFAGSAASGLVGEGDLLRLPQLADSLEWLAEEGAGLFYSGEIGRRIVELCRHGGLLTAEDLHSYRSLRREPLRLDYRGHRLITNPPPSSGGLLIAFALRLLEDIDAGAVSEADWLQQLARVMHLTGEARLDAERRGLGLEAGSLLDTAFLDRYRSELQGRPGARRGTTHVSVIDAAGNLAGLSVSNGEGCGRLIPDTGIMLNNMLGEQDLNPHGFHAWPPGQRMTSMMAPTLLDSPDGRRLVLGSGGSNRIRSAILQVLVNLVDLGLPLPEAIERPRIHLEDELLNVEAGLPEAAVARLFEHWPRHRLWPQRSLFFGGVHAALLEADRLSGWGDPRRGGVVRLV
ncbi:gamma-glutamyltransferase [Thiohalobacter sp. IOR34]|uniref:gamma-glutamyltransferase n=1 Tax=Thiohalobacter sp. IOR34 TaxID=3057176 RepID=UPI0025B1AC87|nr:gamma-glutamyltransferase [Thiohalobacter sp. IOR34]WJW74253.1 gamma-glutamyltransferase [Thiohalobacter sp. IOR34]